MKFLSYFGAILLMASCTIQEAKAPLKQRVVVYTDTYCPADSVIIHDFTEFSKIKVQVVYATKEEIIEKIRANKYNAGMDVLLLSSDSMRNYFHERKLFHPLKNGRLYRDLERQFNDTYSEWLPLCHNPLVLTTKKDSAQQCKEIRWQAIFKDSAGINSNLSVSQTRELIAQLKFDSKFKTFVSAKNTPWSKHGLTQLADLAQKSRLSPGLAKKHCFLYMVENKKYFTSYTSISIFAFARNKAAAIRFIEHYSKFRYQIASNRNQLSTFKAIRPNYLIEEMNIQ